jgi:L-amino acid N-acyltransferase YncA
MHTAELIIPTVFALPPDLLEDKQGHPFQVRVLHPSERPGLEAFYAAFEPKRAAQGLPPEGPVRVAAWLDQVLPRGHHLVVERDGRLVGHAMLMPTLRDGISEYAIFLAQEVRGLGMGTQVNRIAAEFARAAGLRGLWLSVEPWNRAALCSYEKAGFRYVPETVYSVEVEMEMDLHGLCA